MTKYRPVVTMLALWCVWLPTRDITTQRGNATTTGLSPVTAQVRTPQLYVLGGITYESCTPDEVEKLSKAHAFLVETVNTNYNQFERCLSAAPIVENRCFVGSEIARMLQSNAVTRVRCENSAPGVLAHAPVAISGERLFIDRGFVQDANDEREIASVIGHEIMHNRGFRHIENDSGSTYYDNTVPQQVRACILGAPYPWPGPGSVPGVLNGYCRQTQYNWGNSTDNIFAGDFNGDGLTDLGVERAGTWYLRFNLRNGQFGNQVVYKWGNGRHHVFAGDFDADGFDDIGVEGSGQWFIRYNLRNGTFGRESTYNWGNSTDNVFAGDFDGDRLADLGVERGGTWYIRYNMGSGNFSRQTVFNWGNSTSNIFTGDFNGDGLTDLGVERTGTWYVRFNQRNGQFGDQIVYKWGNGRHYVFAGDFDGNGRDDLGVEGSGQWFIRYQ